MSPDKAKTGFERSLRILLIVPLCIALAGFSAMWLSDLPASPGVSVPAVSGMLLSVFFAAGVTPLAYYRLIRTSSSRTVGSYLLTLAGTLLSLIAVAVLILV